jgi:hypothetical protein
MQKEGKFKENKTNKEVRYSTTRWFNFPLVPPFARGAALSQSLP